MIASIRTTLLLFLLAQDSAGATTPTDVYLQAFVNGVDKDYVVHVQQDAAGLRMSADDLITLGLAREALPSGATILLADIDGLRAEYLEAEQRLELTVPDNALAPQLLGAQPAEESTPRSDTGLVLDYSLHVQGDQPANGSYPARTFAPTVSAGFGRVPLVRAEDFARTEDKAIRSASLGTDLRLFSPWGLIFNRGLSTASSDELDYVREDTFWTYSGIESMRTHVIGDFIGVPLTWTRALRLGGVRTSRNFDVQPDLITFPVPALGGTALVPTTVDLLVNGARQFSAEAQPGPFLFAEPPPLTGAGEVAIVYRDALGRDVRITRPLYVDTRLLGDGLLDYDVELGYPRRNYGWRSFEYGEDPAAIGSLRYGVNDSVTLEAHTEFNESLRNLGVGVLLGLSRFGVLTASLARSTGAGNGLQASAGYQYIAHDWSFDLYDRRTRDDFRDLGSFEGIPVPLRLSRASMSLWLAGRHGLSLNYVDQQDTQISRSRIASFGYNASWFSGRVTTYLSVFRDYENADSDGAYFTVTMGFGRGGSAYGGASQFGDEKTRMYGMSQPADFDVGGFGWNLAVEDGNDDYQRANARLEYRGKRVELAATASSTGRDDPQLSSAFDAAGALVWMRGNLMATRVIDDGFALVSTRGLPGIPVLRENRLFGETNRHGYLLVPDLPAYRTSRLSIDLLAAPVDVVAGEDRLLANPRGFSGVLVEFPLERMQGATIVLVDVEQRPLPVGTRVTLIETGDEALVGYDGRVFFATLQADNHFSAETPDTVCRASVKFDPAKSMQTLGPVVCHVLAAP
jgi:outer membrane usher protein